MRSALLRRLLAMQLITLFVVLVAIAISSNRHPDGGGPAGYSVIVLSIPFVLIIAAWLAHVWVLRPLKALAGTVRAYTNGDFQARSALASGGELGQLADEVNRLGQALQRQWNQLNDEQQQLADANGWLSTSLTGMLEGVVVVDRDMRLKYTNPAVHEMLSVTASDAAHGRTLYEVVRVRRAQQLAEEVVQSGDIRMHEFEFGRTRRDLQLVASPLPGDPCPGCVLVFHDVTELRRLENLRRDFVSNVSHELKTPLAAIQAYTETLLDGAMEDEQHSRRFLEHIGQQSERLHAQINDLLTLARVEAQQDSVQLEPVELRAVAAACVAEHQAVADSRQIELSLEAKDPDLVVMSEPHDLRTVLDNLLDNAIKYTPPGGQVKIACRREGQHAVVVVSDTGIGISQEHLSRVFERFYRTDKARSRDKGGTGLGLAIVKHLVQRCGGEVSVTSQPEMGSSFTVRMRLSES